MSKSKLFTKTNILAPIAKKINKKLEKHGDIRVDPYYWMNDREDTAVIDYLNAENKYTADMMSHSEGFQKGLYDEIVARIKKDDDSVPYKKNGYYYFSRFEDGREYPIFLRKKGSLDAEEEILFDQNAFAKNHVYHALGGLSVSKNNEILAYSEDTISRRIYTISFLDLNTGQILQDKIDNTSGRITWANDNKTIFYTVKDETLRPSKIYRHTIGTDSKEDVLVFEEKDNTFYAHVYKTKSDKYIVFGSHSTLSAEYQMLPADKPDSPLSMFQTRTKEIEYEIAHFENKWFILTNWKAKNFRVMECVETQTKKENWKEVIAHRADVLIEEIDVFEDYMVITERINGITAIRVRNWDGTDYYIDFGEKAYVASVGQNPDYKSDLLRLNYTSMTTPNSVFDYVVKDRNLRLLKEQEVIGDFDKTNYRTERQHVQSHDGKQIPISIVYHKNTALNSTAPILVYAYGSYGHSMEPYFSSVRLSLLDRGFVFAIAHIRGGEELGRAWYDDGKMLNKINTFKDFISCTEFVVDKKYCDPNLVFASGGSAGGLLMGAIINMQPDLYKGILSAVPFLDALTTMLDEDIPLTTGEYDEWGNPNEKIYYDYIKSYSPYDNIEPKDYPPQLITTGLHDSQVQYWEPAKYIAKMRDLKTDSNPLLLHTDMETGHGGASGRFARFKEVALEYTFILDLAGLVK